MAELHFYCALCGQSLALGAQYAGELVECNRCRRVVPVPGFAPPPGGVREWLPAFAPEILAVEIKFQCQGCGSKLRVDARWEGRKLQCPHCETPGHVPTWSRPAPAEAVTTRPVLSAEEVAFLSGDDAPQNGASPVAVATG